jgi:hypothetical protein
LWFTAVFSQPFVTWAWRKRRSPKMVIYGTAAVVGALAAMGIVYLSDWKHTRSRAAESSLRVVSPIVEWDFNGFLGLVGGKGEIRVVNFQAKGKARRPILKVSGFVRSDMTNENSSALSLNIGGHLVAPEAANGIPVGADFGIAVPFVSNTLDYETYLTEFDFLERFGAFTFVVEFDGVRSEYPFSSTLVRQQLETFRKHVLPSDRPGVTRKRPQQ